MKLQKLNKYVACVLIGFTAISTTACTEVEEEIIVEEPISRVEVVNSFNYPSGEEINDRLSVYGNLDTSVYPREIYKVLEISDKDQFYRVIIVKGRVDYIEKDNSIEEVYTISHAFSVDDIFTTTDLDNFSDAEYINEILNGGRILCLSSIDKLGDIAKLFGADDEYVDSVMSTGFVSDLDVARMYVSLIPNGCRVTSNELDCGVIVIK